LAKDTRKDALATERDRLRGTLKLAGFDADKIKSDLQQKVRDVKRVLGRQIPQARQMLRKLLADKIELEPVGSGRQRAFKFRGALTIDRLIAGEGIVTTDNTSVSGGPNGIWPWDVFLNFRSN
jgi:hypothetical protein